MEDKIEGALGRWVEGVRVERFGKVKETEKDEKETVIGDRRDGRGKGR